MFFPSIDIRVRIKGRIISKVGVEGVWVHLLGAQGLRVRVILVLRECILDAPVVPPVLPTFDIAGSLGFPPC